MKRIILVCLSIISILSASAQVWVGGTLGGSQRKVKLNEGGTSTLSGFHLSPTVGYDLNPHLTLALSVNYSHLNYKSSETYSSGQSQIQELGVSPYLRYYFAECSGVRFFWRGGVNYAKTWTHHKASLDGQTTFDQRHDGHRFGLDFCPGISYLFNDRVNLLATLGGIGWEQTWSSDVSPTSSRFYANFSDKFSIGFQIYL